MIYLILDTNIWVYLANGLDPIENKDYDDDVHFGLLSSLKQLKENGDITVLVNDIVFREWMRNKEHCRAKIVKLNNKCESRVKR